MRIKAVAVSALLAVTMLAGCGNKVPAAVTDTDKECVDRWIALLNAIDEDDAKRGKGPKALVDASEDLEKDCPADDFDEADVKKLLKEVDPEVFEAFAGSSPQDLLDAMEGSEDTESSADSEEDSSSDDSSSDSSDDENSASDVPSSVDDSSLPCVDRWIALINVIDIDDARSGDYPLSLDVAAGRLQEDCPIEDFSMDDYAQILREVDHELFAAFTDQELTDVQELDSQLNG